MLRGLVVAIAVLALVPTAEARVAFRPPIRRCQGPSSWAELDACFRRFEPQNQVVAGSSAHTKLVRLLNGRIRLYVQQLDTGKWRVIQEVADIPIIGEKLLHKDKHAVLEIDLRAQTQDGSLGLLRMKSAFVCGIPDAFACQLRVVSCVYLSHGRAIDTFLGDLVISSDSVQVVGDRSQVGAHCNR